MDDRSHSIGTRTKPETAADFVISQAKPQMVLYGDPPGLQGVADAARAAIKWSESGDANAFTARFRFFRSGMAVATIAVALKVAMDLARLFYSARDGSFDLWRALAALLEYTVLVFRSRKVRTW